MVTKEFKLTAKSQVTLPNEVKTVLGLNAGDAIYFAIDKGKVEVVPVRDHKISIFDLHKKYHTKPARKVTVEEMNHAINEGWIESGKKSL